MRDFYERVIGLTVTDEDEEQGIVFFSAQPDVEHHEFVLQRGRTAPPGSMLSHQVSWRVDSVETLQAYQRIERDVRQPFRKSLNLEQPVEAVHAEAERLLNDGGPAYQAATWTPVSDSGQAGADGLSIRP